MIDAKKSCLIAALALIIGLVVYGVANTALTTAQNNANITNVFQIVENNTNLAPTFDPLIPGTGERIINVTYTATDYPLQLLVFAHGSSVSQTAGTFVYINNTLVMPESGRPLGAAEEAYRGVPINIPKGSRYRVNFTNFHHYEWREYPILSGRNGTLSVNQTFITNITNTFNATYDQTTKEFNSNYSAQTFPNSTIITNNNTLTSSKVNKSGDRMGGRLFQGNDTTVFRSDTGIEITNNTAGDAGISTYKNNSNTVTNKELFWAMGSLDNAGNVQKTGSISGGWAINTTGSEVGVIRFNAAYNSSGTYPDDIAMRQYGHGGVSFWGSENSLPGDKIIRVFGNTTSDGGSINENGNLLSSLTPTFSGWTQNPGTSAQMTNELTTSITTSGNLGASGTGTVLYDIGSSKRISFHMYTHASSGAIDFTAVQLSDDNLNFYNAGLFNTYAGLYGDGSATGKGRYIKILIVATGAGVHLDAMTLRVYNI